MRLHHPSWTHTPALLLLGLLLASFWRAWPLPSPSPVHFGGDGLPDRWGSPWEMPVILSLVALVVLGLIYRSTPARDRLRLLAVALVSAGAIGNIIDRFRFEAGVVDFLDVGIGVHRWPIFNVADMAVSVGAVLLLISFYFEEKDGDEPEPAAG